MLAAPAADAHPSGVRLYETIPSFEGVKRWVGGAPPDPDALRGRPLLVHIWSSACPECKRQIDSLHRWGERFGPRGLRILGLHARTHPDQRDEEALEAIEACGLDHPVALDGPGAPVTQRFGATFVPAYFVFDAAGRLRHRQAGYGADAGTEAAIERVVEEAAGAGAPAPAAGGRAAGAPPGAVDDRRGSPHLSGADTSDLDHEEERTMQISEIMTRNVQTITPESTLREAARMMRDLDVGGLPVCEGDELAGFVTDRDIVVRAISEGESPDNCKVADVMSKELVWCYEDSEVEDAGRLMEERQVRRLAVVDRNKRLVGILSLGDLAIEGEDEDFAGEVLEQVSEPTHTNA